ncbi:tetratricopeptide repeat protein [Asticcacaulis sp. MM231]|uniref:tetratricopeptide repeat protein n=1 Tax=Asticcacaulis sp. MM231 TaxID=3157666 RepID=UPI0032D57C1F
MVANQGYAPAQYKLGLIYKGDEGKLAPVDKAQARTWIKRAAEGGVPNAMFMLGSMYYNGEGGEQDRSTAAMWFRKSAERGVVDGQFNLGSLYQSGEGVPLNPTEAYKWMRIAADNGDAGAKEAVEGLAQQLSEAQRAKADDAVARFTPISDEAPPIAAPGSEANS